jgi:hypothetical protein
MDRKLADQLRAACMEVALELGAWKKKSDPKKFSFTRARRNRSVIS